LWEFFENYAFSIIKDRENKKFLPGVPIPSNVFVSSDLKKVCEGVEFLLFAVPSHTLRDVCCKLKGLVEGEVTIVSCVKGLEEKTFMRPSEVIRDVLGEGISLGIISGPSHAEEVGRGIPTTVVTSSLVDNVAQEIQRLFVAPQLRVYTNSDLIGVELGGALKNIIAIATGISDGLGFGDNTKAALMTRGLVEIMRLGVAMGAKSQTFAGLSGMGDLICTCISRYSRNRWLGEAIGRGKALEEAMEEMTMVAEGVRTTKVAYRLSKIYGVELPITEQVYQVLFEGKDARQAVKELMCREIKPELFE
jgi:glycerol-3-phosphate dehydrogenase (NAD(P)+)